MTYSLLIYVILIVSVKALDFKQCERYQYKNMHFHKCNGLKQYSRQYFHDVTGENSIMLANHKLYRNHGYYTAMFKDDILYVGMEKYSDVEWFDVFEGL